jgi:hypothetical protein
MFAVRTGRTGLTGLRPARVAVVESAFIMPPLRTGWIEVYQMGEWARDGCWAIFGSYRRLEACGRGAGVVSTGV